MATRSRTSFQKRQKEIARMEKQRDKAARRAMRKLGGGTENAEPDPDALDASVDPEAVADTDTATASGEHTGEHTASGRE
jgi:hypothetical protein